MIQEAYGMPDRRYVFEFVNFPTILSLVSIINMSHKGKLHFIVQTKRWDFSSITLVKYGVETDKEHHHPYCVMTTLRHHCKEKEILK